MAHSQYDAFRSSDKKDGQAEINVTYIENLEEDTHTSHRLRRDLKSRHIIMITIGGAIGTSLINGTYASVPKSLNASVADFEFFSGLALAVTGPVPLFIGYIIAAFLCFLVMTALGEVRDTWPWQITIEVNRAYLDGHMATPPFWLYRIRYSICSSSIRVYIRFDLLGKGS